MKRRVSLKKLKASRRWWKSCSDLIGEENLGEATKLYFYNINEVSR